MKSYFFLPSTIRIIINSLFSNWFEIIIVTAFKVALLEKKTVLVTIAIALSFIQINSIRVNSIGIHNDWSSILN